MSCAMVLPSLVRKSSIALALAAVAIATSISAALITRSHSNAPSLLGGVPAAMTTDYFHVVAPVTGPGARCGHP